MPLFKCDGCGALENTALGNYWAAKSQGKPVQCSECHQGEWHGRWPKDTPEQAGFIEGTDGFYYKLKELAPNGYFARFAQPKTSVDAKEPRE